MGKMDYPNVTLKATVKIIPLQIKVWCVWDDGEIDEPREALALATKITEVSCEIEPKLIETKGYKGRTYMRPRWGWPDDDPTSIVDEDFDEFQSSWVFIPEFEGPWTALEKYAFTSEERAKEASRLRKERIAEEKANAKPTGG